VKKWIQTSKIGLWFYAQTQTKNWFTSKTFWNSAAQKVAVLAVILLGIDPGLADQLAIGITAFAAFGVDMWVRKRTTVPVGDPMPSKVKPASKSGFDEHDDYSD